MATIASMSRRPANNGFSSSEDEVDLVFRDKNFKKHCLILQEYDGKGVFILPNRETPSEPVVGLTQIVHFFRRSALLQHPYTIRDIVRNYVNDVSVFEESSARMNLVTNFGVRINLSDPPISLFRQDKTVTLYLQNKKYLPGKPEPKSSTNRGMSNLDWLIIACCIAFVAVAPFIMYWLITKEVEVVANLKSQRGD